jgi:hypothetical protein
MSSCWGQDLTKRAVPRLLAILACVAIFPIARGQAQAPAPSTRTFRLPLCDQASIGPAIPIQISQEEMAFRKEPDFGARHVVRSAIVAGDSRAQWIWFAWDRDRRTLHVDLNRNRDLTDDPQGVVSTSDTTKFQSFTFPAQVETSGTVFTHRFQLWFYGDETGGGILSGWRGAVELAGAMWTLSVTDNLDGVIGIGDAVTLSRPLTPGEEPNMRPGDLQLGLLRRVFLDGRAYRLELALDRKRTPVELLVSVTEENPALGELKLDGQMVRQVVFNGGKAGWLACVKHPGMSVTLPVGDYTQTCLEVAMDGNLVSSSVAGPLRVMGNQPARLRAGGPVKGEAQFERAGRVLTITYALTGAGGENYVPRAGLTDEDLPGFAVYKNGRKVFADKFQYG